MKGRTNGQDVLNALLSTLSGFYLLNLISATTDGAPAMAGSTKGFFTAAHRPLLPLGICAGDRHDALHLSQESLGAKAADMKEIISVVVFCHEACWMFVFHLCFLPFLLWFVMVPSVSEMDV